MKKKLQDFFNKLIMKPLKKILIIISLFTLSCASAQYVENYEPINIFLETQNLEKGKKYILQRDKVINKEALRLFNQGEGAEHIVYPTDTIDYTGGLFEEEHWKKMYNQYAQDTIKKYWNNKDFPMYDLVLENKEDFLGAAFIKKYLNTRTDTMIFISEPMYYKEKMYVMFYYNTFPIFGSSEPKLVIMKKESGKWVVTRIMEDYIYY